MTEKCYQTRKIRGSCVDVECLLKKGHTGFHKGTVEFLISDEERDQ
ncbi:MAG: hypothetical protein IIC67_02780 [Thaumarchaeota archaeon]|nr:hypothetical protein [Nitrososphaerota archaeon]